MLKNNQIIVIILFICCIVCLRSSARPTRLNSEIALGEQFMQVRLLGTLQLRREMIDGQVLTQLSDLAWDNDENCLYAITDKGRLFHIRPVFQNGFLIDVNYLSGYKVEYAAEAWRGTGAQRKTDLSYDIEGLAVLNADNGIQGDSELIISFESIARIGRFTTTGAWIADFSLPAALAHYRSYLRRNKMLESVTVHPQFGLLTTPEWSLRGVSRKQIVLYDLTGKTWTFPRHSAPNSAVTSLETLDDGSILVLERSYVSLFHPLIIALRRIWLDSNQVTRIENVAIMRSDKGWNIDNFEGLTQHKPKHFFMVTDDNSSVIQRILLSYFALVD